MTIDAAVAAALERAGFPVLLGSAPYAIRTRSGLVRVDHHFAPERRLTLRAHLSERRNQNVEGKPPGLLTPGVIDRMGYCALSPSSGVHEFRCTLVIFEANAWMASATPLTLKLRALWKSRFRPKPL